MASTVALITALLGFVLLWLGNEWHEALMATAGGILFGGGVMYGAFGR
jgi:hypothetical protein